MSFNSWDSPKLDFPDHDDNFYPPARDQGPPIILIVVLTIVFTPYVLISVGGCIYYLCKGLICIIKKKRLRDKSTPKVSTISRNYTFSQRFRTEEENIPMNSRFTPENDDDLFLNDGRAYTIPRPSFIAEKSFRKKMNFKRNTYLPSEDEISLRNSSLESEYPDSLGSIDKPISTITETYRQFYKNTNRDQSIQLQNEEEEEEEEETFESSSYSSSYFSKPPAYSDIFP